MPARPGHVCPRAAWPRATGTSPVPYPQRDSDRARATTPNPRLRQDGANAGLANRRPRAPEAHDTLRPRPIVAREHPELRLPSPMVPLANGRLTRALAAPRPYPPATGAPPRPSAPPLPYKRVTLAVSATLWHRPKLRLCFLLYAAARLPWSSHLHATPHSDDFSARFATSLRTSPSSPWPPRRRRCAGTPPAPPPAKLCRRCHVPTPTGYFRRPKPAKSSSGEPLRSSGNLLPHPRRRTTGDFLAAAARAPGDDIASPPFFPGA
uniref:Uncharacterized protein n=1 Tax=Setaria viridis TaxID=4556 RepID=A0A4U6W578_SETVI|nr:hypothetical protein SEVIR_1G035900v2 [Setaria viridis]